MQVLTVDVGSGTQDILLLNKRLEFKAKMVLPAPTQLYASFIRRARKDIFCGGYTMGGGAITGALRDHAEKYRVVMTPEAARTVRDDPAQVREYGIEIGAEKDMKSPHIKLDLRDIDMGSLEESFRQLMCPLQKPKSLAVAVAVQDHGVAPKGMRDREFRIGEMAKKIRKGATFKDFAFTKKSPQYTRASAVLQSLEDQGYSDTMVMDTKIAGISGGLCGELLPAIAIDIGNGHTTAASVAEDGTIAGMFEHHTHMLTPAKMQDYIERLASGTLTHKEIFDEDGHGAYIKEPVKPKVIVATGPRREIAMRMKLKVKLATPLDDVYMVGPVGLAQAYKALHE